MAEKSLRLKSNFKKYQKHIKKQRLSGEQISQITAVSLFFTCQLITAVLSDSLKR